LAHSRRHSEADDIACSFCNSIVLHCLRRLVGCKLLSPRDFLILHQLTLFLPSYSSKPSSATSSSSRLSDSRLWRPSLPSLTVTRRSPSSTRGLSTSSPWTARRRVPRMSTTSSTRDRTLPKRRKSEVVNEVVTTVRKDHNQRH